MFVCCKAAIYDFSISFDAMKFSYNWIRELVPGLDTSAQALERLITMKTAECEGVEEAGAPLATASPARVVSAEPIEASPLTLISGRRAIQGWPSGTSIGCTSQSRGSRASSGSHDRLVWVNPWTVRTRSIWKSSHERTHIP